jgi:hypothetical protein
VFRVHESISSQWVHSSIGKCRSHDRHAFISRENGTNLKVEFQSISDSLFTVHVETRRPWIFFSHHVGETPVPVGWATFWFVSRFVETYFGVWASRKFFPAVEYFLKPLLSILYFRIHHTAHHNSTRVDARVVRDGLVGFVLLWLVLQTHEVKCMSWWLSSDVVVHVLRPKFIKPNQVTDRLAARLNAELLLTVTNREMLAIDSSHWNTELLGVHLGQLRDISGIVATFVWLNFLVNFGNDICDSFEVRYSETTSSCSMAQSAAWIYSPREFFQSELNITIEAF